MKRHTIANRFYSLILLLSMASYTDLLGWLFACLDRLPPLSYRRSKSGILTLKNMNFI